MTDDLPFDYPSVANPGAVKPRVCRPHRWADVHFVEGDARNLYHIAQDHDMASLGCHPGRICTRCWKRLDPAASRRGKNNRSRGNAEELAVARKLGGRKMGPLGLPWDVEMRGYARLQVRKYATPESLRKIAAELGRIGSGVEMPGYVWVEPGRGGARLIVFRLSDFAERHGDPTKRKEGLA